MFIPLFLLLLGNLLALLAVSTQYYIQTIDVSIPGGRAVAVGPMWGDSAGNLYFSDLYRRKSNKVRKMDSTGRVTIVVGSEAMGDSWVTGLYGDTTGDILYLSQELNQAIWRHNISSNTTVKIAGKGRFRNENDRLNDGGSALSSSMLPTSLFLSSTGMLYFCDPEQQRVRMINTENQIINTFAGNHDRTLRGGENVPATSVWLYRPTGVWGDSLGFIYIADRSSNRVRRVTPAGIIATFAGNGRYTGERTYMSLPDPRVGKEELGDNGPAT